MNIYDDEGFYDFSFCIRTIIGFVNEFLWLFQHLLFPSFDTNRYSYYFLMLTRTSLGQIRYHIKGKVWKRKTNKSYLSFYQYAIYLIGGEKWKRSLNSRKFQWFKSQICFWCWKCYLLMMTPFCYQFSIKENINLKKNPKIL